MNVVICDDEQVYRKSIASKVETWAQESQHSEAIMVHSFASSEDLLDEWKCGLPIDILFLDIQIPNEMSGLETAKTIFRKDEQIPIVFTTNYSEYACEGYAVNALRYLIKPVTQSAVTECMTIAWHRWVLAQSESLRVDTGSQTVLMPLKSILLFEVSGHDIKIYSSCQPILLFRGRIADYIPHLPNGLFCQCHKSYIVNVMYVRKIHGNSIMLSDNQTVPIGRKYALNFLSCFNRYYQGR